MSTSLKVFSSTGWIAVVFVNSSFVNLLSATAWNSFIFLISAQIQSYFVGNQAKRALQSTPHFPKNKHFLPPDTHTNMCVSGGKKCLFFGKFGVLCFLETSILRFALLPYYRRFLIHCNATWLILNYFQCNTTFLFILLYVVFVNVFCAVITTVFWWRDLRIVDFVGNLQNCIFSISPDLNQWNYFILFYYSSFSIKLFCFNNYIPFSC